MKDNTPVNTSQFTITNTEKTKFTELEKEILGKNLQPQFKKKVFYEPILVYTCNSVYKELNNYLRCLEASSSMTTNQTKEFVFACALIQALKQLRNFVGATHRGIKDFRFSTLRYQPGQVFNWKSFTSTSTDAFVSKKFVGKCGSIFHINSLTGRDISEFSFYKNEGEVLLLPFTYFIVDKIETKDDID